MGTFEEVLQQLELHRLVPVVTVEDSSVAGLLGEALKDGGLPAVEITLRTPSGLDVIQRLAADPELIVGAGTVVTTDHVDLVARTGARFVVSPGFDRDVVSRAVEQGLLPIPGIATATELQAGLRAGLEVFKFFPAEALGGVRTLRALSEPFQDVRFMPTGGITPANVRSYLDMSCVFAIGSSWPLPQQLLDGHDQAHLTEAIAEAAIIVHR